MAFHLPPPEKYDFRKPETWSRWLERFENFRTGSELNRKTQEVQVSQFLYIMGSEALDVVKSLNLSAENMKDYAKVKKAFDDHFIPKRNVIFERAQFNKRVQEASEPVGDFITDLYVLSEHCSFPGNFREELVRDRIVVGIKDEKLSTRLQMKPDLTLADATLATKQSESVKKQQSVLHEKSDVATVSTANKWNENQKGNFSGKNDQCGRCGKNYHPKGEKCPAIGVKCFKCQKHGHFGRMCRSKGANNNAKSVSAVETQDSSDDEGNYFLGSIKSKKGDKFQIKLSVGRRQIQFKIDTGAEVTCLSEEDYSPQFGPLIPQDKPLFAAGEKELDVIGMFTEVVTLDTGHSCKERIYVVKSLRKSLLGEDAIEALGLINIAPNTSSHLICTVRKEVDIQEGLLSIDQVKKEFPKLWTGLGRLPSNYSLKLKDGAQPYAVAAPRRVALPIAEKVKKELKKMEKDDVIVEVKGASAWCAPMVPVVKPSGAVRICVDYTKLNESVIRERHIMPSVEQTIAQIGQSKYYSKMDANSSYYQVPLSKESQILTTFCTPIGRFAFKRLPFGISSAPEHFQLRMQKELEGIPGVLCLMDDCLVTGVTKEQHNQRLRLVLEKMQAIGLTLNPDKCCIGQTQLEYLGQIIDTKGVRKDPVKVKAIAEFETPKDRSQLRSFMGMVNHLAKFVPELSEKATSLNELLSTKVEFVWGPAQESAFKELKEEIQSERVLVHYDPLLETIVSADASSYGLGGVLLQKQKDGSIRPVAFASRSLTITERHGYAQIEKEALATTWCCQKFREYLVGIEFHIETDHKPLVPLLTTKAIDELPPRIQKFRMKLLEFKYSVSHVPGKNLVIADALSRAPLVYDPEEEISVNEVSAYVAAVTQGMPASEARLEEIQHNIEQDSLCQRLIEFSLNGWPDKTSLNGEIRKYWPERSEITVQNGFLMKGSRLIIPQNMREDILTKVHEGHLGITKTRNMVQQSIWWPGLSTEVEELCASCEVCAKHQKDQAEPLVYTEFPDRPWQKLGTDLFEYNGKPYLLYVDYFSRYPEINPLTRMTAECVVHHSKSLFARHGIPEEVFSDNGPCYSGESFAQFSDDYGFTHKTSSPRYPQSNGLAERTVQTVKNLLQKADDPYLALLQYRATPLQNGYSPSELLMGRKLRTNVPIAVSNLDPKWPYLDTVKNREGIIRKKQAKNYDIHHKVHELPQIFPGYKVWIKDMQLEGTVVQKADSPRSYLISVPSGNVIRRNRRHLAILRNTKSKAEKMPMEDPAEKPIPCLSSGNAVIFPENSVTQYPVGASDTDVPAVEGVPSPVKSPTSVSANVPQPRRSGRERKPLVKMNL